MERTRKAIEACGRWLAFCRADGWPADSLDDLEAIWWRHHDERGNLIQPTPDAAITSTVERTLQIGDEVRVTESYQFQEWRNDRLWVAGLAIEPGGKLNITVSTRWPVETLGDLTDRFRDGDLALAPRSAAPAAGQEGES